MRQQRNATQRSAMSIRAWSSSRMTPSHTVTYRRDSRWVGPTLLSKAASSTESYRSLEGALRRQTAPLLPKAPPQPVGHHLNSHTYSAPPQPRRMRTAFCPLPLSWHSASPASSPTSGLSGASRNPSGGVGSPGALIKDSRFQPGD